MREQGFYWVCRDNRWEVAKWARVGVNKFGWVVVGTGSGVLDCHWREIDERRIERQES